MNVICTGTNMFSNQSLFFLGTSNDGGTTWTPHLVGQTILRGVAASADGKKIAAFTSDGNSIYTSPDGGSTWVYRINIGYMGVVASSADGTKLIAASSNKIFRSLDGGVTWTTSILSSSERPPADLMSIGMSANGARAVVADLNFGLLFTSNDGGITWTAEPGAGGRSWTGVRMSADGNVVMGVGINGGFYVGRSN